MKSQEFKINDHLSLELWGDKTFIFVKVKNSHTVNMYYFLFLLTILINIPI